MRFRELPIEEKAKRLLENNYYTVTIYVTTTTAYKTDIAAKDEDEAYNKAHEIDIYDDENVDEWFNNTVEYEYEVDDLEDE